MKKLITFSLIVILVIGLTACAGSGSKQGVRVKCPACGYEFEPSTK